MLSIKSIRQGQDTNYYFEKDNNYYFKEDQAHLIEAFTWGGKGAMAQGLSGQVHLADFERVMAGVLPSGQQLGLKKDDTILHRPGFDLTFSAPKSVSILALAGGDDRLIDLHQSAVLSAMSVVERLAQARVTKGGETTFETTRNLTFAQFLHDTSREGDPQLHTHVVIANMTQCMDGLWRSLASDLSRQNGFYERVMNDRNYFGLIYRAELAKGLKEMGFKLRMLGKDGLFEIEGVPESVLKLFSKRREQILSAVKEWGATSVKAYDVAALNTRKSKTAIDRQSLMKNWDTQLGEDDWDLNTFLRRVNEQIHQGCQVENTQHTESSTKAAVEGLDKARELIADTLTILSQKSIVLHYNQILKQATEYGLGHCRPEELVKAFDEAVAHKAVIQLDSEGRTFATQAGLKTEVSLIDAVKAGQTKKMGIHLDEAQLLKRGLSNTDKQFVKGVLEANDRIIEVRYSAENKHALLDNLLKVSEDNGKTVKILSPNAIHATEVNEKVTRNPQSLWEWLKNIGKESVSGTVSGFNFQTEKNLNLPLYVTRLKNGIVVVDGAQKIAPDAMNKLFEVTDKLKAKVVLLHDVHDQHLSFQGDVMRVLEKSGIHTIKHNNTNELKALPVHLFSVKEDHERLKMLAMHYALLPLSDRQNTCVVAQNQREAHYLNQEIRTQLKNSGQLGQQTYDIRTFQPVFLSKSERKYAAHYEKGMVLRYYEGHEIKERYIQAVLKEENTLSVLNEQGVKEKIACRKIVDDWMIFKEKTLAISEKESLQVTGNMKELGLIKGEKITVQSINATSMTVEKNGKRLSIAQRDWDKLHVDYHYVESLTQVRHEKAERVMTSIKSRAINQETLATLSKRGKTDIIFYTDDPSKVARQFQTLPERTCIINEVMKVARVEKELTPSAVSNIKQELAEALATLNQTHIKTPVEKAVDFAIAKLSERNAGFKHEDLVKTAVSYALGDATMEDVEKFLRDRITSGELVHGKDEADKTIWTTKEAIAMERAILSSIETGKNTLTPLADPKKLQAMLDSSTLNQGQKEACHLISTTRDRFVMIQGYAGTGKSTMLASLVNALKETATSFDKPVNILACAPMHQAVKELETLGIQGQTLKSLLVEYQKQPQDLSQTIILLDESSMVSNRDFHDFQCLVEENNGRAAYVGDTTQYLGVESGKPTDLALRKGVIAVAYMTELVRQTNETVKDSVKQIIQKDFAGAFHTIESLDPLAIPRETNERNTPWITHVEKVKSSIIEIPHPEFYKEDKKNGKPPVTLINGETLFLQKAVVKEYLSRTKETRDNTIVIVGSHADRRIVHGELFDGLRHLGEIEKEAIAIDRLVSKGLTRVELRHANSYQTGDYLKIGKDNYVKIVAINKEARSLTAENSDGKKEILYPERLPKNLPMESYQKEQAEISTGMRIKFTKTDKERQILANREWQVLSIDKDRIHLKEKVDGRLFEMNPQQLKDCHWDYAYTVTGYGAQSSSYRYVLGHMTSQSKNLSTQRAFYIVPSRAKQHVMILTDDKEALLKTILANTGDKYAALEVIGELDKEVTLPSVRNKAVEEKQASKVGITPQQKRTGNRAVTSPKEFLLDAKSVEEHLKNKVELVTQHLLGEPNKQSSTHDQWRYGSNKKQGSLVVTVHGEKKGLWYDFGTNEGGGMLKLIQNQLSLDFKAALAYGASLTGEKECLSMAPIPRKLAIKEEKSTPKKTSEKALKLIKESIPISGTLAEKYLNKTRHIDINPESALRFVPRAYTGEKNSEKQKYAPAMLSIAKDKEGKVRGVQVTYLDLKTQDKANLPIKKRSYGSVGSASVLLQSSSKKEAKTYIAEGVETGLSVANASPHSNVITTLGKSNFSNIDPETLTKNVVFCLDNDGKNILQDKGVMTSIQRLSQLGKNVSIVLPDMLPKHKKTDFNDLMRQGGVKAIQDILNKEVSVQKMQDMSLKLLHEIKNTSDKKNNKLPNLSVEIPDQLMLEKHISDEKATNKALKNQVSFVQKMEQISNKSTAQQTIKLANMEREI